MAEGFNGASRFSIAGLRELPEDISSARQVRVRPVNSRAALDRSIRRAPALPAPADPVLREVVPVLAHDLVLGRHVLGDLVERVLVVQAPVHLRVRLRVRSVRRIIADAAAASNTRRPRKAR
jgi:hypothetical protein